MYMCIHVHVIYIYIIHMCTCVYDTYSYGYIIHMHMCVYRICVCDMCVYI